METTEHPDLGANNGGVTIELAGGGGHLVSPVLVSTVALADEGARGEDDDIEGDVGAELGAVVGRRDGLGRGGHRVADVADDDRLVAELGVDACGDLLGELLARGDVGFLGVFDRGDRCRDEAVDDLCDVEAGGAAAGAGALRRC